MLPLTARYEGVDDVVSLEAMNAHPEDKVLRRKLREARALTFISGLFVIAGPFVVASGDTLMGVTAVFFFGGCMLVGIVQWRGGLAHRDGTAGDDRGPSMLMPAAALLMGVGCLAIFILALLSWETFATDSRLPREVLLAAGGVGTILFGGGSVLLFFRAVTVRRNQNSA